MAFIFKRGKKSPADLISSTSSHIGNLINDNADQKTKAKSLEKVSLHLCNMKFMLYGDSENRAKPENVETLQNGLLEVTQKGANPLLLDLLDHMKKFQFEAQKDAAQVINFVLRNAKNESIKFIQANPKVLKTLVQGYNDVDVALNCGTILREAIRHPPLNKMLLESDLFDKFFEYVQSSTFDLASDAFATFKLMLTKHPEACSTFLEQNFESVFVKYNILLQSRNYVTKRQSLKLLGELLLNRKNFNVMMRYINDPGNLKIIMTLLREQTKAIQFEAFHVFKIFVANPKKSKEVEEILVRNRDKLLDFLNKFQKDKDDQQFNSEKQILLNTLSSMAAPPPKKAPAPAETQEQSV